MRSEGRSGIGVAFTTASSVGQSFSDRMSFAAAPSPVFTWRNVPEISSAVRPSAVAPCVRRYFTSAAITMVSVVMRCWPSITSS